MDSNVFGTAITGGNRKDRAVRAQQDPNADKKRDLAIAYVRKQKADSGNGVSTLCIFYNATGATMLYHDADSYVGKPWDTYPMEVQNGQWGAFLHVKSAPVPYIVPSGSMGYVIYRVKGNDNAGICSSLIGWETPWNIQKSDETGTRAFCDIYDDKQIDDKSVIYENIKAKARQCAVDKKGMRITTTIESDTSPLFEAHFKLGDALDSE